MVSKEFYDIFDKELLNIIEEYKDTDDNIKRQSNKLDNQKSYAFLIWFLNFYAKKIIYRNLITEGNDDNSCDIIFDNLTEKGERIYYVVQSKWNTKRKISGKLSSKDIKYSLNDFETILNGGKQGSKNEIFKKQADELIKHRKNNGKVKFIFLALTNKTEDANDNINDFEKRHTKTKIEIIDINRIKKNFIEYHYKKIDIDNPLEFTVETPKENTISLKIERLNPTSNQIKIGNPFKANIFLMRPSEIHRLFKEYGFTLFFKNVRNPLLKSYFNKEIKNTIIDNPMYFWYYNNGITAITYNLPDIAEEAENFEVDGFQIINGTQTVYAIYSAYEEASLKKRKMLDNDVLITLRLLKSGGKDFDLQVTRFTNSQNPVSDRDFRANDAIQTKIQNFFYNSNFWYEKRKDEFREIPENVAKIDSDVIANMYLAFHLQDPVSVRINYLQKEVTGKDLIFISHEHDKDGMYEKIFNGVQPKDMLASFYIGKALTSFEEPQDGNFYETEFFHILALSKSVFQKYLILKGQTIPGNQYIINLFEKGSSEIIIKILIFVSKKLSERMKLMNEKNYNFLTNTGQFEQIKNYFEDELKFDTKEIEELK